jgi:putative FmdB family regulatory protein
MPIYEYECSGCHHQFDQLQKVNDEPIKKCPQCSKNTAVRLVSAAGFQLKGSGWYETDFKNKGQAPTKSSTTSVDSSSSSTTESTKATSGSHQGETD